jgi:light-regulated signal transduction histidine kinase (bacteriophytochrome)
VGVAAVVCFSLIVIWNQTLRRQVASRTASLQQELEARKRAEEALSKLNTDLAASNQELESFCYTISHDLRAPLRAIDGYSKILIEDYRECLDGEGRRVFDQISASAIRMGQLIDDLLAFSRVGRVELVMGPVAMEELCRSIFDEIVSAEDLKRIELRLAVLPNAWGDRTTLRQVWSNLLSNAVKYSSRRQQAVIEVGGEQRGAEMVYWVRDNGVGFDMMYIDKLFGVFHRLHGVQEFPGTGVGLAIVDRVVKRHGGRVWAEGEVDRGATFFFALPIV